MRNLRQAQSIIRKIDSKYNNGLNSVKWNDIYNSEDEMVEDLKNIHVPVNNEFPLVHLYGGYEYIHSFAKQVQNGKILSEKQIRQCKRLALEIKKAVSIKDCY